MRGEIEDSEARYYQVTMKVGFLLENLGSCFHYADTDGYCGPLIQG